MATFVNKKAKNNIIPLWLQVPGVGKLGALGFALFLSSEVNLLFIEKGYSFFSYNCWTDCNISGELVLGAFTYMHWEVGKVS